MNANIYNTIAHISYKFVLGTILIPVWFPDQANLMLVIMAYRLTLQIMAEANRLTAYNCGNKIILYRTLVTKQSYLPPWG